MHLRKLQVRLVTRAMVMHKQKLEVKGWEEDLAAYSK